MRNIAVVTETQHEVLIIRATTQKQNCSQLVAVTIVFVQSLYTSLLKKLNKNGLTSPLDEMGGVFILHLDAKTKSTKAHTLPPRTDRPKLHPDTRS